jgi:hypothetical protein
VFMQHRNGPDLTQNEIMFPTEKLRLVYGTEPFLRLPNMSLSKRGVTAVCDIWARHGVYLWQVARSRNLTDRPYDLA